MHVLSPTGQVTAKFRPLRSLVEKEWILLSVGLSFSLGIWSLLEDQEIEHGQDKCEDSFLAGSFYSLISPC